MSNIEVGEYVRTKQGFIAKLKEYLDSLGSYLFDKPIHIIESDKWSAISEKELEKQIVKHSKNIIDLIEVGDYVNGEKVTNIDKYDNIYTIEWEYGNVYTTEIINDKFIKSIVTKEQFKEMEYRVDE